MPVFHLYHQEMYRVLKNIDIYTGKSFKRRTTEEFPMPDSVVRHMNDWGKKSKSEEYG